MLLKCVSDDDQTRKVSEGRTPKKKKKTTESLKS
jgi:hypothetical protein